ncbi:MAG TPA: hypothetical protein VMH30_04705 [Verrucomicrobiae bacterium]|nr:hypothetical protein [Verrucomicrobiae bacterium]
MWAGNIRTWKAQRIKRLACIVESGCEKSLLGVLTQNRVATKRIMHRNVHDVASIKAQPANGAGQFSLWIWVCKCGVSRRFSGRFRLCRLWRRKRNFRLGNTEFCAAIRAINFLPGGFFIRFQFSTARRAQKTKFHNLSNAYSGQISEQTQRIFS